MLRKKIKYKYIPWLNDGTDNLREAIEKLNDLGQEGWKLDEYLVDDRFVVFIVIKR